jgi:cyclopropane fatty-acyl-phospholipid synthase-like methyltransferase
VTSREAIARYFDATLPYYRRFWHGSTGALHFGMSGRGTRHHDELIRTNEVLAEAAGLRAGERVFDAGCGVGGSAIWLARERDVRVFGVTLSAAQVGAAREAARHHGVGDRVEFQLEDYARTSLPDGSVDVVWALESACYAPDPAALLAEARRVLRAGGRIVVADGFLRRAPRRGERRLYGAFRRGLVLPDLPRLTEFLDALRGCGLDVVRAESRLRDVTRSCRRLFWRCLLSYPLALLACGVGRVSREMLANSAAGISLYPMVILGLVDYALVVAVKPVHADRRAGDLLAPDVEGADQVVHV